ncbi:MAG: ATP-binding protein [Candidatus Sericytochromatia bacterium]
MINELELSYIDFFYERVLLIKREYLKKKSCIELNNFIDSLYSNFYEYSNIKEFQDNFNDKSKNFDFSKEKNEDYEFLLIINQFILCIMGKTASKISLSSEDFSESEFIINLKLKNKNTLLCYFYILKIKLCYLFEEDNYGLILSKEVLKNISYCYSDLFLSYFYFYYTLIIINLSKNYNSNKNIKLIDKNIDIIKKVSKLNDFYIKILELQKKYLINKEEIRIKDLYTTFFENSEDVELSEQELEILFLNRIESKSDFLKEKNYLKSFLLELIYKYYFHFNSYNKEYYFINKAYSYYKKYGFKIKITQLEKKYSSILSKNKYNLYSYDFLKEINEQNSYFTFDSLVKSLLNDLNNILKTDKITIVTDYIKYFNIDYDKIDDSIFNAFVYNKERNSNIFTINITNYSPFKVIKKGIIEKKYFLCEKENLMKFLDSNYINDNNLNNFICIPIMYQNELLSIIYIENIKKDILEKYDLIYFLFFELSITISQQTLKQGINALDFTVKRKKETIQQLIQQRDIQMELTQKKLIESAHKSGMAEVATGVIHNIGNILNSLNISNQLIYETLNKSKISGLIKANQILKENINNMENFIKNNDKSKKLFDYYLNIGNSMDKEIFVLKKENKIMEDKITLIKNVITTQQQHAKNPFQFEKTSLNNVVEDALSILITSINKNNIKIFKHYNNVPEIKIQKTKLLNVIINLVKNSIEALENNDINNREINISIDSTKNNLLLISVFDNGEGIEKENIDKIFTHGFTTKEKGFGFGLHTSANSMTEMEGKIEVESEGKNKGAKFTIYLKNSNLL